VQDLLKKVSVSTGFPLHQPLVVSGTLDPYTCPYPDKVKAKVEIKLKNGDTLTGEKEDYHGFFTRPFTWEEVIEKFKKLSTPVISDELQENIISVIRALDEQDDMSAVIDLISIKAMETAKGKVQTHAI
jgi:2-methylcitrate dehydratase